MGRIYYVQTGAVSVSAAQDLLEIVSGTDKTVLLHSINVSQEDLTGDEMIQCAIKRATGAFTSGSGGSSGTVTQQSHGDAANSLTVERNNTTQAVAGSGALDTLWTEYWYAMAGFRWRPEPGQRPPEIQATDAFIVSIDAPSGPTEVSCVAVVEEIG